MHHLRDPLTQSTTASPETRKEREHSFSCRGVPVLTSAVCYVNDTRAHTHTHTLPSRTQVHGTHTQYSLSRCARVKDSAVSAAAAFAAFSCNPNHFSLFTLTHTHSNTNTCIDSSPFHSRLPACLPACLRERGCKREAVFSLRMWYTSTLVTASHLPVCCCYDGVGVSSSSLPSTLSLLLLLLRA